MIKMYLSDLRKKNKNVFVKLSAKDKPLSKDELKEQYYKKLNRTSL